MYSKIYSAINSLQEAIDEICKEENIEKQAFLFSEKAEKELINLRKHVDFAETIVANDLWPMAKYHELMNHL